MSEAVLKWAGGKRWLVRRFPQMFHCEYERYVEPFLGSGAVYFHIGPKKALLADKNTELMNLYSCIKSQPDSLMSLMRAHAELHSKSHYYLTRASNPATRMERAARFLYLNRTCWNGLYRENRRGEFNVPIGTKNTVIFEHEDFRAVAAQLSTADLSSGDFTGVMEVVKGGDLVFIDPPYTVKHNNNGFIKYNEQIFSWADQERLAKSVRAASMRGANIIVTNAYHESVLDLYKEFTPNIFPIRRQSVLAGSSAARGEAEEAVILVGNGLGKAAQILMDEVDRNNGIVPLPEQVAAE